MKLNINSKDYNSFKNNRGRSTIDYEFHSEFWTSEEFLGFQMVHCKHQEFCFPYKCTGLSIQPLSGN
jgi:hypothetical protein